MPDWLLKGSFFRSSAFSFPDILLLLLLEVLGRTHWGENSVIIWHIHADILGGNWLSQALYFSVTFHFRLFAFVLPFWDFCLAVMKTGRKFSLPFSRVFFSVALRSSLHPLRFSCNLTPLWSRFYPHKPDLTPDTAVNQWKTKFTPRQTHPCCPQVNFVQFFLYQNSTSVSYYSCNFSELSFN